MNIRMTYEGGLEHHGKPLAQLVTWQEENKIISKWLANSW